MAQTKVHPAVKAWQEWLKSDEGQDFLKPGAVGQYLENRLWTAFMAGAATDRPEKWLNGKRRERGR